MKYDVISSVLIVEDNLGDYLLIREYLLELFPEVKVHHANNFKEAKTLLKLNHLGELDLILLDLSLPDKKGEQLILDIKRIAKSIPIIVLTGQVNFSFSFEALSIGVSDYLLKDGLNPDYLSKSIFYSLEKKNSQEKLRAKNNELKLLSLHIDTIREEERKYISREIHDDLGQDITALKMEIDWMRYEVLNNRVIPINRFDEMLHVSDGIISKIRRIASDLRPGAIDDLGLLTAIEMRCKSFAKQYGIELNYSADIKNEDFGGDFRGNIYRLVQESLTNIARHAQASVVTVRISESPSKWVMQIIDNGIGMDDVHLSKNKSLGLLGMKERVNILGGSFLLDSKKGEGTRLIFYFPFDKTQVNNEHSMNS